jgi:cytosine/adenosine deaminase-related metal-dependent hydrolase
MATPFDKEELRMQKVSLPELHGFLIERVNRTYMPHTHQDKFLEMNRPRFNSKPEYLVEQYVRATDEQFFNEIASFGATSFFAYGDNHPDNHIYAGIYLANVNWVIVVNLTSLDTRVGEWKDKVLHWHPWPRLRPLAIDRFDLEQQLSKLG